MTCNTFNNPATKQSSFALTPEVIQSQIYSFDQLFKLENDPTAKYESATLVQDVRLITELFITLPNRTDYPMLNDRVIQGPITIYELADFLDSSGFSIYAVDSALLTGITSVAEIDLFNQLNYYYTDNMAATISGGFCSTFTGALSTLMGLISSGSKLISDLQNLISGFAAQLEAMKQLMFNLVDKLVGFMREQINAIVNKVNSIASNAIAAVNVIRNKITKAQSFFESMNIDTLKAAIEELIAGLAGNYEKLTPEVIAYLLFRFCQLLETINNFLKAPVDSLKSFIKRFALEKTIATNFSNTARLESVHAGLFRMDPFTITSMRKQMSRNINSNGGTPDFSTGAGSTYITMPITEEEIQMLNSLSENGNQYIQWSPQVLNMGSNVSDANPGDGWRRLNGEVIIRAMRIARRMGARLYVNSGYRSPQYNAAQPGAASNSLHMSGKAMDISMTNSSGLSNTETIRNKFIEIASQEGIGGIGTYSSFIHIDIGPRRTWGSSQTTALSMHRANRFRTGGTPASNIPVATPAATLPSETSSTLV